MAGDVTRVIDDSPSAEVQARDVDLVAVRVAGEHEVPRVPDELGFGIGIVIEEDGGAGARGVREGFLRLDLA